ncbi:flagellar hook-basal body complex protein FliE [Sphingobium boeckii]|uniref:Flagellar hook-basal body complex protein FliE n=1 Tax=Sphingobium boeckii TaxID=1082345 RepID=A0A7W9AGD9_9SPHN|nr:flagellar hook-basal body complex protein FliE [Sphingobium boeckii]MBB5685223.1 flagellar hook-basal body complex protein FliE [Sphingobium boeckii]
MSIGTLDATTAYSRALKTMVTPPAESAVAEPSANPASFGGMIQTMVTDAAASLRTAESESAKQVAGKGDMIDMVTAIGAAETALETVVAVRDRVVNAYSEIMRMQI